jgi:glycolate oxidase FAD binding subunit
MDSGARGARGRRAARMTTQRAADRIRAAERSRQSLRIVGSGSWLGAGGRVDAVDTLSTMDDRGIVEYVPGDLTLTARAGTPIAELYAAVKANDQWLPLDPWGGDRGTVGATLSTATTGPHAHAMGLPRDVVLGIEFVSGTGDVIRPGGRVVKNVAGFDLTRVIIGAWGTLGVITEVTLRLRARPAALRTFLVPVETAAEALNRLAVDLRAQPFTPVASELINAVLAQRLGVGTDALMLVRLAGNTKSVDAQTAALRRLGPLSEAPADIWRRLRECDNGALATWRRSQLPSAFGHTWSSIEKQTKALELPMLHGNPLRGVVRVIASGPSDSLRGAATTGAGTLAIEVLPGGLPQPDSVERLKNAALEQRIRNTFDPARILNPGIMGGT